jgi:hypothetical protein
MLKTTIKSVKMVVNYDIIGDKKDNTTMCKICKKSLVEMSPQELIFVEKKNIITNGGELIEGLCGDTFHKTCITQYINSDCVNCPTCDMLWQSSKCLNSLMCNNINTNYLK